MEIFCDKPGVQFFTGNFLDSTDAGKGGTAYKQHNGFCLETQNFPDSIHQPDWPSMALSPGDKYRHAMVIRFSTKG